MAATVSTPSRLRVEGEQLCPRVLRPNRGPSRDLGAQTIVYLVEG